jgi:SNF2 family DNA or RNA helicase
LIALKLSLQDEYVVLEFDGFDEYRRAGRPPKPFRYDPDTRTWYCHMSQIDIDALKNYASFSPDMLDEIQNSLKPFYIEGGYVKLKFAPTNPTSLLFEAFNGKATAKDCYAIRKILERELKITVDTSDLFREPKQIDDYTLPDFLLEHQVEGVSWIIDSFAKGYHGVILADDMGLGKTVQALTSFFVLKELGFVDRLVVVANKSTINNAWIADMKKFFNAVPKVMSSIEDMDSPLVVTNYEYLAYKIIRDGFKPKPLDERTVLILDEATKAKNMATDNYKAINSIKGDAFVIALTGTPVENNLQEYFSILTIVFPHFMNKALFNRLFAIYKEKNIKGRKIVMLTGHKNVDLFYELSSPFVLRRTKELLSLPDKNIIAVQVQPTAEQEYLVEAVKSRVMKKFRDQEIAQMAAITIIRRIYDDPRLIEKTESNIVSGLVPRDLTSPKMKALRGILQNCKFPVVIFTEYEDMAELIVSDLSDQYRVAMISGQSSAKKRDEIIQRFKQGEFDILVATDALAYGVNLQFAHTLINYDIPWNPARRSQRMNRIHRIGSSDQKTIYDIVAEGIEMAAYRIIVNKLELFAKAVEGKEIADSSVLKQIAKNFFSLMEGY